MDEKETLTRAQFDERLREQLERVRERLENNGADQLHTLEKNIKQQQQQYENKIKARRKIFSIILILAISLIIGVLFLLFLTKDSTDKKSFDLAISIIAIAAVSFISLIYLQPNSLVKYGSTSEPDHTEEIRALNDKINKISIAAKEDAIDNQSFTEDAKKAFLDSFKKNIESEALREYQDKLLKSTEKRIKLKSHEDHFNQMANRLSNEVQALAKRGNINLLLGIATTLSGLAILGYTVFDASRIKDMTALGLYFLPRISLVILIEVFAYFFLGLYKQSLSEIKYFQNELTNIESKYLAVKLTLAEENNESVKSIAKGWLATERNFPSKKGESTVELEKQRMDSSSERGLGEIHEKLSRNQNSGHEG